MKSKQANYGNGVIGISFWCPGCKERHTVPVNVPPGHVGASWTFNGDWDRPTLSPSLLLRSGHYANTPPVPGNCYCDYAERHPDQPPMPKGWTCSTCHFFLRDGKLEYCGDSTHALAGQTVDLPDLEDAQA
jgi:hypothetical protein